MNLPPYVRWLLGGLVAGLAASQELIEMSKPAHSLVAVGLVVFAALGIVPPHVEARK